jgi:hypothetical protein
MVRNDWTNDPLNDPELDLRRGIVRVVSSGIEPALGVENERCEEGGVLSMSKPPRRDSVSGMLICGIQQKSIWGRERGMGEGG